ncbi:MAG: NAD-dependent epimerase/dehydratase family protein, partial [Elusimicrobia bacterium]|nr:NAD-dependent epimerase/dehydratase family protein [Elusimicrobiota bacterium]
RCPVSSIGSNITQINGDRTSPHALESLAHSYWDVVFDNICYSGEEAQIAVKAFLGRVGLWIFTSTGDVHLTIKGAQSPFYETQTETLPEDENVRLTNSQPYGLGKRDAEKVLLAAHKDAGFPAGIIRFPIVIGPDDPKARAYSYWLRILDNFPLIIPDGGNYYRRYIYSHDTARALDLLIENVEVARGQIFHFGDSMPVTLREWLEISANLLGKEFKAVVIPNDWLLRQEFKVDICSPYFNRGNYVLSVIKAENLLGWKSTPMREWMSETIKWYFSEPQKRAPENYSFRKFELELIKKWENFS